MVGEQIFSSASNLRFLRLQVAWPEMISPCLWEDASIVLQLGFLAILFLCYIRNNLDYFCKGRKKLREVEKYPADGKYGLSYKLSIICSILMLSTQVVVLVTSQQQGSWCESKASLLSSRIMQMISWTITLIVLYKLRSRNQITFPWILRFWWTSSFLLSAARAMIDAHCLITHHDQLGVQEYDDIVNLATSICLLILSIRGKTGATFCTTEDISEPLLNGKTEKNSEVRRDNPYGNATLIQLVTFSWLNPLFEFGYKKVLDQDEVPDVDTKDSAAFLSQEFDECLKRVQERDGSEIPSIYKAMYIFARKKAGINAVFAITSAGASYVGPYLISYFVQFLNEKEFRSLESGYLLALGFLGAKLIETITQRQWIFGARQLGLRLRAALISQIYKKGLILSSQSRQKRTSGEIINYMSVDVQRITDFIWYLNYIWMLPVQISLAIYILHLNLGMGYLVALAATMIVMAGNIPLTRIQKRYQTKIMEAKDDRMKSTSEVLKNMKTLKLQAWDTHYLQKLVDLRKIEHNWLWKSLRLSAVTAFIFWGSPTFISVFTFGGCVLMGIPLTAGRVLSALATFRMLQDPIFNLPDLLNVIAQGKVSVERISSYLTTVKGGALVPIILLAQSSFQVLQVLSNYWMAWACPAGDEKLVVEMDFILLVYALLAVGSSLCVLVRASLVAVAGLRTSETLFSNMLKSIFRSPMAFFDSTPTGRILNRASTDQSVLDLEMANRLGWCAFSIIQLLGTIAVMSQVAWEVFVIFIPVTAICIWYQRYYIPTARELARLAGIERAPILHHFSESLTGAATIRAFNQHERFTDANLCLIDNHSRPWFHNVSAMEWLSFRLNQLANFVFAFSLVLLVTLPEGIINPSIAGLAVTYGINLNVQQASVIWNICNAENKMISVERILQYSNLASEAPLVIEDSRPPSNWPDFGTICFKNLQIRYAEHLPSVLKNITCTFPGRKKVGVVGRTGSGKSTLIQAIFRIVEAREGSIVIDDVDVSKIGLHDLRSRLSIIPQDPTMFEGTVRGNLDPLEKHSDTEIWEALDKCQLGDIVRQKPNKLESTVVENGENWSVGQRQLFCLGRALLKKSSILVLDEATASVDSASGIRSSRVAENDGGSENTVIHRQIGSDEYGQRCAATREPETSASEASPFYVEA